MATGKLLEEVCLVGQKMARRLEKCASIEGQPYNLVKFEEVTKELNIYVKQLYQEYQKLIGPDTLKKLEEKVSASWDELAEVYPRILLSDDEIARSWRSYANALEEITTLQMMLTKESEENYNIAKFN